MLGANPNNYKFTMRVYIMDRNDIHIFISYAHADGTSLAQKLQREFESIDGMTVFLDESSIQPGQKWREQIDDHLRRATHFLFIVTPGSLGSKECRYEWGIAKFRLIPIIPVYYVDCQLDGELGELQYIDFREQTDYEESVNKLIDAIRGVSKTDVVAPPMLSDWWLKPISQYAVSAQKGDHVACIRPDITIAEAFFIIDHIAEYRYRHLLVTPSGEANDTLLGMLSLRKILKRRYNPRASKKAHITTAADIMDRYDPSDRHSDVVKLPHFVTIRDDAPVEAALQAFRSKLQKDAGVPMYYYMSAIPLVDRDNKATGIISFKDVMKAIHAHELPLPETQIGPYVQPVKDTTVYYAEPQTPVMHTRFGVAPLGQRDVPVVNNPNDMKLIGLVPDHILIENQTTRRTLGEVMIKRENLRIQTPEDTFENILHHCVLEDHGKVFYSFPVVSRLMDDDIAPEFIGLIGYRDLFGAMLDCIPEKAQVTS